MSAAPLLPPLTMISAAERIGPEAFLRLLESVVAAGLPAVQVREPGWDEGTLRRFLPEVLGAVTASAGGCRVLVNGHPALACEFQLDGVHVGGGDPQRVAAARSIVGDRLLVGYSAHTLEELPQAASQGADYVTYSPVFGAISKRHPLPAVGLGGLEAACRASPVAVYALGGVRPEHAPGIRRAGAAGAAMIGALVDAPDPAAAVREFLRGWSAAGEEPAEAG